MKYFKTQNWTTKELKTQFRNLCKVMHPDKGGNPEQFKEMLSEYQKLLEFAFDGTEEERKNHSFRSEVKSDIFVWEKAQELLKTITVGGIELDIVGSWIWISGNTFQARNELKSFGCRYSKAKKSWYWFNNIKDSKKRKGSLSLKKIKERFGVQDEFRTVETLKLV